MSHRVRLRPEIRARIKREIARSNARLDPRALGFLNRYAELVADAWRKRPPKQPKESAT